MSFIIFDTEYTSWKGCQENGWIGNQKKEIVQIAALKVSDKLEVIDEFNYLCKPIINPVLSDYFVDLTHISNEKIEKNGKSFKKVYSELINFVGDDLCYSHAWGAEFFHKSDGDIIDENLNLYGIKLQNKLNYRNIAPIFKQLYAKHNIDVKSQSSGQIVDILRLSENLKNLGINPHDALYDVYSILEGLKYFYPTSLELMQKYEKHQYQ